MNMKKIMITAVIGLFAAISVQAQEIPERKHDGYKPHSKERGHNKKEMADLNLSEEQKTKFKELNKEHRQQMEDLKKQDNITVKESRERMEKIRKEHQAKMQSLLTTEQKAKIEKNKLEQREKRVEMGTKRAERMKTELGLTDEQSAKMLQNRKDAGEKMKAIREDKSLTEEQKKEKIKELYKQQKETLKSVLTEEQMKKLKESDQKRKEGHDRNKEKTEMKETK
jgi:Spy/CpxP family protein refolding chaperone